MAETLKINYKTLTWHFRKHIEERKLIKGYVINWMGTKYDYKAERALNKKHTYLVGRVLFSDLDQPKRMEVMAQAEPAARSSGPRRSATRTRRSSSSPSSR